MDRIFMQVAEEGEGAVRVTMRGMLTPETNSQMKTLLELLLAKKPRRVDLDCAGVEYIASAGVGTLVSILRKLTERGGSLRILNPRHDIAQLFSVTRLDRVFTVVHEAQPEPTV